MTWEVHDRDGRLIYMTSERWQHALEKRPWLAPYLDDVLTALRRGRRRQDPLNPRKYKYYVVWNALWPDFNHLVVIVLFGERLDQMGRVVPNNYVTNVWAVFIYGDE